MTGFARHTLTVSSNILGTYVHGFNSGFSRPTPIAVRHNFWDTTVLLDGSYPALLWEHEFVLYTEGGSLGGLAATFLNISDKVVAAAVPLKITYAASPTVTLVDFGSCYLQDKPSLIKPDMLLHQEAGFIRVSFLGSTKPTVS
jgi:hypothetical protein